MSEISKMSRKRILVMDDEDSVVDVLKKALERNGFRVEGIADGERGYKRLLEKKYDLILCDIRIPGMSGKEIYTRIKAQYPELLKRIIFTTGDVISPDFRDFFEATGSLFLKKPFELDELYEMVDTVISEAA